MAASPPVEAGRDDRAYALMQSAIALAPRDEWSKAAAALEEAARLHAQAARAYDEARCLQMAATLRRSAGDVGAARRLAAEAAQAAPEDQPLAISIAAEQAETAFVEARYEEAVAGWTKALDAAGSAGLRLEDVSALHRRRAAAFHELGRIQQSADDFDAAYLLAEQSLGRDAAAFVRTEQAHLLWQAGEFHRTAQIVAGLMVLHTATPADPHLAAEIGILRARLIRTGGEAARAAEVAERARQAALKAVAPLSFFAASVELSEDWNAQAEPARAYGILAICWATLSDVLGGETARSWVEPCLLAWRVRWGEAAFLQAKTAYETTRRAARATS